MRTSFTGALALLGVCFALLSAEAAAAGGSGDGGNSATPASLTGEVLLTAASAGVGSSTATGTCNPLGTSTFTFEVTGEAIGPYPGTFVERGTFTLGPVGFPLVLFDATFTIDSPVGLVTGSKTLEGVLPTHSGACGEAVFLGTEPEAFHFQVPVRYTAQITTPSGTARDSGNSFVTYSDTQLRGPVVNNHGFAFDESFESTSFLPGEDDDDDDDQGEDDNGQGED